jgi:hypothetical protein
VLANVVRAAKKACHLRTRKVGYHQCGDDVVGTRSLEGCTEISRRSSELGERHRRTSPSTAAPRRRCGKIRTRPTGMFVPAAWQVGRRFGDRRSLGASDSRRSHRCRRLLRTDNTPAFLSSAVTMQLIVVSLRKERRMKRQRRKKPVILSGGGSMAESKDLQYPRVFVRS